MMSLAASPSCFKRRNTWTMASFMMSAAVPWMGMFNATRSPKERMLKLEDLISGRARRRR